MSMEKKNLTKTKLIHYILNHPVTSKAELAKELNLSMPTVLTNVNELIASGIIAELGEYESTGGRKAKSIGINPSYARAVGVLITANHLEMVLVNLGFEVEREKRIRLKFSSDVSYCMEAASAIKEFMEECALDQPPLGIGVAIPGILDPKKCMVVRSHALKLEQYSLRFLEQALELPVCFENDANAAMLAENPERYQNALYLSLNHTLGGAFCLDGQLCRGQNQRAGEFGHMVLVPGGHTCYCGKAGCADAYCAASVLTENNQITLDAFMQKVKEGNPAAQEKWETYLDHLAILISNLRMAYDMDIILGGDVGGVLSEDLWKLSQKVMDLNGFDRDVSYLKKCTYAKEASAVGAARQILLTMCE